MILDAVFWIGPKVAGDRLQQLILGAARQLGHAGVREVDRAVKLDDGYANGARLQDIEETRLALPHRLFCTFSIGDELRDDEGRALTLEVDHPGRQSDPLRPISVGRVNLYFEVIDAAVAAQLLDQCLPVFRILVGLRNLAITDT